ncbi:hypothetical protein BAY61_28455 [Prauserella marina]|nr:hypothetical protein BAY61_28455 [Prauserella marina]
MALKRPLRPGGEPVARWRLLSRLAGVARVAARGGADNPSAVAAVMTYLPANCVGLEYGNSYSIAGMLRQTAQPIMSALMLLPFLDLC